MKIVTLLPSATEIVCALGLADRLVGVSHDCDYPPEILNRRVLSDAIVTAEMSSGQIDTTIRTQVHTGKSVYHLDSALLTQLKPDLILTQELCQVCAPSFTEVRRAARVLEGQTQIVSLEPHSLDDILETIRLVGRLTGTAAAADALILRLHERIERVRRMPPPQPRPRVACIEWLDPIFLAGHWVPEMVAVAGATDGLGRPGKDSYVIAWDTLRAYAPEVLVVMPCGFDIARTRQEMHLLTDRLGLADLPAVRTGRVFLTDASAYFSRPGPRIVRGLEILADIVHAGPGPLSIEGAERLEC